MKKILTLLFASALIALGTSVASAQTAPHSVLHVVTVTWKAGSTPEQIKAALDGAQNLPAAYKGITHVWTKTIKAQGERTHVIAMEFADAAALKSYTDSPAQKEWYKAYLPIRDHSTTFDVTNE